MEDKKRDIGIVLTEVYDHIHNKQEIAAKLLLEGKVCKNCSYHGSSNNWCPFRPEKPEEGVCPLFRWNAYRK